MAVQIRRSNAAAVISMTPLIDVVFLLLIFFLVTSRFADEEQMSQMSPVERELDISLPDSSEAVPLTNEQNTLFVTVTEEGRYFLQGESLTGDQLESKLETARTNNPAQTSVVIRGDKDSRHKHLVIVWDICKRLEIPCTTATDSE
ncbi:MAG: biopolymer transporter ExbD [Planctomycetota bacterium]|nr:biopolymer transporter ExbD [Planctomycetota bacterium]